MAIGNHYALKFFGTILAQQFLNTFAYRQTAGAAPLAASDLAYAFDTGVLAALKGCVGSYATFDRIEAFAIEVPSDYIDRTPVNTAGTRAIAAAQQPPSYMAFAFRSNRAGAGSRASYKRFCGMSEDDSDGNALTSTYLALVLTSGLQSQLQNNLTHSSGNVFQPVQLQSGWVPGTPPVENLVINSYGVPYLTSQVSRRP